MLYLGEKETERISAENGTSVTIGKFDGVHLGHKKLICDMLERAKEKKLKSCIVTFKDIPKSISSDSEVLTTEEERKYIFEKLGVDAVVIRDFNEELRTMNPYEFIDAFLIDSLNMRSISIGPDFHFGREREGDINNLAKAGMIYGFGISVVDKKKDKSDIISSTFIKDKLRKGDLKRVNRMLGYNYMIIGSTVKGKQLGRKMNVPTLNILPSPEKLLPPNGVYMSYVSLKNKMYKSITNIGLCPTVNKKNKKISVETHILDMKSDKEMYGENIRVELVERIRNEIKFSSEKELYAQMKKDILVAKKLANKQNT